MVNKTSPIQRNLWENPAKFKIVARMTIVKQTTRVAYITKPKIKWYQCDDRNEAAAVNHPAGRFTKLRLMYVREA